MKYIYSLIILLSSIALRAQNGAKAAYLFKALEQEDYNKINKYLDSGVSINCKKIDWKEYKGDRFAGRKSRTPLLRAIELKNSELIEYLIECGADVNQSLEVSWYEICDSCPYNAYYKKPQRKKSKAYTPLSLVVAWGDMEIIDLLISNGADISMSMDAIKKTNSMEVLQFFLDKNLEIDFSPSDLEAIYGKSYGKDKEVAHYLLDEGVEANGALLYRMVERKDIVSLKKALNNGADVNSYYKKDELKICALCKATLMCDTEIVRLLIENYMADTNAICTFYSGGNTNLSMATPLQIAQDKYMGKCRGQNDEMIEYLLFAKDNQETK